MPHRGHHRVSSTSRPLPVRLTAELASLSERIHTTSSRGEYHCNQVDSESTLPFAVGMPPDDVKEFLRAFGDAIRAHRKERGLSQEAFADEIPLYRSYVADVERGARNLGLVNALRVARALEVPLSQLIADAEQRLEPK